MIEKTDAATDNYVSFYAINCCHPLHFCAGMDPFLADKPAWLMRLKGALTNTSKMTHAELEVATSVDRGDIDELSQLMKRMKTDFGWHVLGGCCGTYPEDIERILLAAKAE